MISSLYSRLRSSSQLSDALGIVSSGRDSEHAMVTSSGTFSKTGAVVSSTVMVQVIGLELPHSSVTVHVRSIV